MPKKSNCGSGKGRPTGLYKVQQVSRTEYILAYFYPADGLVLQLYIYRELI